MIYLLVFISITGFSLQFQIPKQFMHAYYKTHSQVYPIPDEDYTYNVYVGGKVGKIKIPNIFRKIEILDSSVIDIRENSAIVVLKEEPYIITRQGTYRKMVYPGELIKGKLIVLGDGQAIYVPFITNRFMTKPKKEWNYLEMLKFAWDTELITVTSRIPWLDEKDWEYILSYRYQDHIFYKDKLFILISRTRTYTKSTLGFSSELSIIGLCLKKGARLLDYPIEIHVTTHDFLHLANIAFFYFNLSPEVADESERYAIITAHRNSEIDIYFINDLPVHFNANTYACSSRDLVRFNTFHKHLRYDYSDCVSLIYDECENDRNVFPSGGFDYIRVVTIPTGVSVRFSVVHLDYPFFETTLYAFNGEQFSSCKFDTDLRNITCQPLIEIDRDIFYLNLFTNVIDGDLFVASHNSIYYLKFNCSRYSNCIHCIMFGRSFGCQWTGSICEKSLDEFIGVIQVITVNSCFKIVDFTPKAITSEEKSLKIKLSPFPLCGAHVSIRVSLGSENYCTNIIIENETIHCDLVLTESGFFPINVTIYSSKYANALEVTALTKDVISVIRFNYAFWIFVLILVITTIIFILCIYFANSVKIIVKSKKSKKNYKSRVGLFTRLNYTPHKSLKTRTSSSGKTYEMSQTVYSGKNSDNFVM